MDANPKTLTAAALLDKIYAALSQGATIRIATRERYTDITQRTVDRWRASGHEVFRATDNTLYMARGKHWDAIHTSGLPMMVQISAF